MDRWDADRIGNYTIEGYIGLSDGFEEYRGRHAQAGTPHVLRLLVAPELDAAKVIVRDANALRRLQHPNVMAVSDVVRAEWGDKQVVALVTDLLDGPALTELLAARPLRPSQLDELARGILRGAAAAHRRGRVHGRIDAEHVVLEIVDDELTPRVTGYGFATAASGDVRQDVFDLGVLFYTAVAGHPPFAGAGREAMSAAVQAGEYRPIDDVVGNMADRMSRTIEQALSPDPELTFSDAYAMLQSWESETPQPAMVPQTPKAKKVEPEPVSLPSMPPDPKKKRSLFPLKLLLPFAGVLTLMAVGVAYMLLFGEEEAVIPFTDIVDRPYQDFIIEENVRVSGRDGLRQREAWDKKLFQAVAEQAEAGAPTELYAALERRRSDYMADVTRLQRERMPIAFAAIPLVTGQRLEMDRLRPAWTDKELLASGAAVQITVAAYVAGYEPPEPEEPEEPEEPGEGTDDEEAEPAPEPVDDSGAVRPAFERWSRYRDPSRHPDFIGENLTCPQSAGRERCGGLLYSDAQAFVPEVLAAHLLAVCYFAANDGSRPPFDTWRPYLDGYCEELDYPGR